MTDLLAPGTYFAGHRILGLLGIGGHGNVYEALTPPPEQARRAIKLVAAEANQLPKLKARLAVEGVILATIEHENVVRFYDAGVEDDHVWILLELVEGRSLQQWLIDTRGALPIERVMRWLHRACEGVAAAHAVGVVHRDLKPSNILIHDSDGVKVIDFGVAYLEGSGVKTTSEQRLGTALYMAPEQVRGADADPRMDVYAIGMLAYEALAGMHPIGSKARALADVVKWQLVGQPRRLRDVAPEVPEDLEALVHQAIDKDPARRPQSMRAVADRLAELIARSRAPQRRNARNALRSNDPALAPTTPMAAFSGPDPGAFAAPPSVPRTPVGSAETPLSSTPVTARGTTVMPAFPDRFVSPATTLPLAPTMGHPAHATPPNDDRPALLPGVSSHTPLQLGTLSAPISFVPETVAPDAPNTRRSTSAPMSSSIAPREQQRSLSRGLVFVGLGVVAVSGLAVAWWVVVGPAPTTEPPHPARQPAASVSAPPSASSAAPPARASASAPKPTAPRRHVAPSRPRLRAPR